jgi:hypothetical protein
MKLSGFLLIIILFSLSSCDFFLENKDDGPVYPKYTAKVVWRSYTDNPSSMQKIYPEILWESLYNKRILAVPVIKGNMIYAMSYTWSMAAEVTALFSITTI